MKRFIALFIVLSTLFTLTACESGFGMLFQSAKMTIYYDTNGGPEVKPTTARITGFQIAFQRFRVNDDMDDDMDESFYKLPKDPVWEGYVFLGWYWDNETFYYSQKDDYYKELHPINEKASKFEGTLYARWVTEELYNTTFTITYKLLDEALYETQSVLYSRYTEKPEDPYLNGYTFSAWFIDKEHTILYEFDQEVRGDLTLYAEFGTAGLEYELNTYGVYYYVSSGTTTSKEYVIVPHFYEGKRVIGLKREAFTEANSKTKWVHLPGLLYEPIDGSFEGNTSIEKITISSANLYYQSIDGILYNKTGTRLVVYPGNREGDYFITPPGVTTIQAYAFSGTMNLKHVTLRSEVSVIELFAFQGSKSIEVIDFEPNSELTEMNWHTFAYMEKLQYLFIPHSVETLHGYGFAGLFNVILLAERATPHPEWEDNWKTVYDNGYVELPVIYNVSEYSTDNNFDYAILNDGTVALLRVVDPSLTPQVLHLDTLDGKPITALADNLFAYNDNLLEVTLPVGIETIPQGLFYYATNLHTVHFEPGTNIHTIGIDAFALTFNLNVMPILETVTKISRGAFSATGLTEVIIPSSVLIIEEWAFGLKDGSSGSIYVQAETKPNHWQNGWVNQSYDVIWNFQEIVSLDGLSYILKNDATAILKGFSDEDKTHLVIPETVNGYQVTVIKKDAFSNNQTLESVIIPDSITVIEDRVFNRASNLETVTISNQSQLTRIGNSAFRELYKLESIYLPEGLEEIGNYAFNSTYMRHTVIPSSVEFVGLNAFQHYILNHIIVLKNETETPNWHADWCTDCFVLYSATSIYEEQGLKYVILNDHEAYFYGLSDQASSEIIEIAETVLGRTVRGILRGSFYQEEVKTITIPKTITFIDSYAITYMYHLTEFEIPVDAELTTIRSYAFYSTLQINTITIPISVHEIQEYAFTGNMQATFYIAANEKPLGWHTHWNTTGKTQVWGYTEND